MSSTNDHPFSSDFTYPQHDINSLHNSAVQTEHTVGNNLNQSHPIHQNWTDLNSTGVYHSTDRIGQDWHHQINHSSLYDSGNYQQTTWGIDHNNISSSTYWEHRSITSLMNIAPVSHYHHPNYPSKNADPTFGAEDADAPSNSPQLVTISNSSFVHDVNKEFIKGTDGKLYNSPIDYSLEQNAISPANSPNATSENPTYTPYPPTSSS